MSYAGAVQEIPLTRGFAALVDAADFDRMNQWNWCFNTSYAMRRPRKADRPCESFWIIMHRVIIGAEPGQFVDHIDGDGLNNTRANLRLATQAQNMQNKGPARLDKLKGAFRSGIYWQAVIIADGARHYLGSFGTELEAALVYDDAARRLHGAFARLNFPEEAAA